MKLKIILKSTSVKVISKKIKQLEICQDIIVKHVYCFIIVVKKLKTKVQKLKDWRECYGRSEGCKKNQMI